MTLRPRLVPALFGLIILLVGALLLVTVEAFAGPIRPPRFGSAPVVDQASFVVPKHSDATWTLNLWAHGRLIGTTTGTSGTLSVHVFGPQTCLFQADVRVDHPGDTSSHWYSGNRVASVCCPTVLADSGVTATVISSPNGAGSVTSTPGPYASSPQAQLARGRRPVHNRGTPVGRPGRHGP